MGPLAAVFVDIALHRSGPDRLPSSSFLVGVLLAIYIPVNLLRIYLTGSASSSDYGFMLVDTVVFYVFVYGILRFFGRQRRFLQTASALLGTDILINLIGLPVSLGGEPAAETGLAVLLALVLLALLFWWIDVAGFIIARAVEQPYVAGVMFVVFYVVAALAVLDYANPAPS